MGRRVPRHYQSESRSIHVSFHRQLSNNENEESFECNTRRGYHAFIMQGKRGKETDEEVQQRKTSPGAKHHWKGGETQGRARQTKRSKAKNQFPIWLAKELITIFSQEQMHRLGRKPHHTRSEQFKDSRRPRGHARNPRLTQVSCCSLRRGQVRDRCSVTKHHRAWSAKGSWRCGDFRPLDGTGGSTGEETARLP